MGAAALRERGHRLAGAGVAAGLLALALLRLVLIHANMPAILYWEEPYRLVIATEILGGPRLPLWEYQADHYQGGSLAVGLLALPLVAVAGASLETLKLVPLALTLATAILWCVLLWRAAGAAAAALFAWIMALAPPMAQIYQVHAMGSHAETALFTAAGFLLVREIAAGRRSRLLPFALGLVGGLGLWFCYTAASGIAAWGLFWLLCTPRGSLRRGAAPLAAGALLGLSPWIAYNLGQGFRGLDRLFELLDRRQEVITGTDEPLATRLQALFAVDLPRALGFPESVPGVPEAPAWIYLFLLSVSLAWLTLLAARRLRRHSPPDTAAMSGAGGLALLIVLFVALHLTFYAASTFRLDVESGFIAYRFFSPLFAPAAAAMAMAVTQPFAGTARRPLRAVAAAPAVVALVLGGYGTLTLLREQPGRAETPVESGYRVLGLLSHIKYRDRVARAAEVVQQFTGKERELALFGYGWGLQFEHLKFGDWPTFVAGLSLLETPSDRELALRGARWSALQGLRSSREHGNAGFRTDYSRRIYVRQSELAARLKQLPQGG